MLESASRETVVINALRVVAHTSQIDPDFLQRCVETADASARANPGFGSYLEQNEGEFLQLLQHVKGCRSALEIGSRYGKSILRIAEQLEPQSSVVAVDMPCPSETGALPPPEPILRESMQQIANMGHKSVLFLGNSHSESMVEAVREHGPFDFCFIDGDHTYEGAKADWENYGPMTKKIVAFHDIINNPDCFRLWNEIKAKHRTVEYTSSVWLGIGVVLKDN